MRKKQTLVKIFIEYILLRKTYFAVRKINKYQRNICGVFTNRISGIDNYKDCYFCRPFLSGIRRDFPAIMLYQHTSTIFDKLIVRSYLLSTRPFFMMFPIWSVTNIINLVRPTSFIYFLFCLLYMAIAHKHSI